MAVPEQSAGNRLVLSLHEPLVAGGAAEDCERRIQQLFREGYRHLVVDLRNVRQMDSAGVRSLVRGYTTALRLGGSFRLVGPTEDVRRVLELCHLDTVLGIYESVEEARARDWSWKRFRLLAGGSALCAALVWAGLRWPQLVTGLEQATALSALQGSGTAYVQPFVELLKLVAAALIGVLVTAVQQHYLNDKPLSRSLVHAQALLCTAGALMMIIIGNSLPRAFGIAGAASIVRFRTPVEDPKDITVLFLLMGLGMSCGLGAFAVAGLGTAFLCLFLVLLEHWGSQKPRPMTVELVAEGREFPAAHVERVFARNNIVFEPREVSQGKETMVKYHTMLNPGTSLDALTAELMSGDGGIKSLSWASKKT